MLRLNQAEANVLLDQPETGMGYQVVEATIQRAMQFEPRPSVVRGIVYNAELMFIENETQNAIRMHSYQYALRTASASDGRIRSLRVLSSGEAAEFLELRHSSAKHVEPAKEAPVESTDAGERFVRFSAYENDHRVTADGRLRPGSYATTEEDSAHVRTGMDAVRRYALPNPEPASYRFSIAPWRGTPIQRGVAEPANGQPGGGVEVIFPKGTDSGTVKLPPTKIPDE